MREFIDDLISSTTDLLRATKILGRPKKSYMVYWKANASPTLIIAHSKAEARSIANGKKVKRITRWR